MVFNTFDIILMYLLFLFGLQLIFLSIDYKKISKDKTLRHIGTVMLFLSLAGFTFGFIQSYIVAVKEDNLNLQDFISLDAKESFEVQLDSLIKSKRFKF